MAVTKGRVLVAIPAWNEVETVGAVVREVRRAFPAADVLVVDDGSDDATAEVSRQAGAVALTLPFNVGVGGAMRTAFVYAVRGDYDVVVQVDADGQHDPAYIPALVDALAGADVVIGSRFAGTGEYRARGPRRWAMRALARSLSRVTGETLTDTTSGFRANGRAAVGLFAREYPAEYLGDTVDSIVLAARAGLRVTQVPVAMRSRQGGRASAGPVKSSLYLGRSLLALAIALTRTRSPSTSRLPSTVGGVP